MAAAGPFKWDPDPHSVDQFARIVRHENVYDPAYLDAITYQTFPDRESMTLALAADEIDLSPAFPPEQFQSFEQNQDFNLVRGRRTRTLGVRHGRYQSRRRTSSLR